MSQPSMKELVQLFKDNNYYEIGYVDGIKRYYWQN
jgi:hypothetical protein